MKQITTLKLLRTICCGGLLFFQLGCEELQRKQTFGQGEGVYNADFRIWTRSNSEAAEDGYILDQWVLNIPKEHIESYRGKSGVPAFSHPYSSKNRKNSYAVNLRVVFDPETSGIRSHPSPERQLMADNEIRIRLSNAKLNMSIREFGFCETPTDRKRKLDKCASTDSAPPYLCSLYMNRNGWSVNMSVDRKLMTNHLQVCKSVDQFLSDLSVAPG